MGIRFGIGLSGPFYWSLGSRRRRGRRRNSGSSAAGFLVLLGLAVLAALVWALVTYWWALTLFCFVMAGVCGWPGVRGLRRRCAGRRG